MRTSNEDREVTQLMREFDRTVLRLRQLGVDILQVRCGEELDRLRRRMGELTHPGDNGN